MVGAAQNAAQSATDNGEYAMPALRDPFKNVVENNGSHSWSPDDNANSGRGGSRTRIRREGSFR